MRGGTLIFRAFDPPCVVPPLVQNLRVPCPGVQPFPNGFLVIQGYNGAKTPFREAYTASEGLSFR